MPWLGGGEGAKHQRAPAAAAGRVCGCVGGGGSISATLLWLYYWDRTRRASTVDKKDLQEVFKVCHCHGDHTLYLLETLNVSIVGRIQ